MGKDICIFLTKWTNSGDLTLKTFKDGKVSMVEYLVNSGMVVNII